VGGLKRRNAEEQKGRRAEGPVPQGAGPLCFCAAGGGFPAPEPPLWKDLTFTAPGAGGLGDAIGAQDAAANLDVNALTVVVTGGGNIASVDKTFSCPGQCDGVHATSRPGRASG
jgi:hypothetical protein